MELSIWIQFRSFLSNPLQGFFLRLLFLLVPWDNFVMSDYTGILCSVFSAFRSPDLETVKILEF